MFIEGGNGLYNLNKTENCGDVCSNAILTAIKRLLLPKLRI
jgi:hypothetical protein